MADDVRTDAASLSFLLFETPNANASPKATVAEKEELMRPYIHEMRILAA